MKKGGNNTVFGNKFRDKVSESSSKGVKGSEEKSTSDSSLIEIPPPS